MFGFLCKVFGHKTEKQYLLGMYEGVRCVRCKKWIERKELGLTIPKFSSISAEDLTR